MKKFIHIIFLLLAMQVFSQEKELITVLDFLSSGVSEQEVHIIVDFISSHIVESGLYRVIDRMQRETILNEWSFSLSGCTDEKCQIEVGKLLMAEKMIVGSIGKIGSLFILNMKLIDVESGETLKTASQQYNSIEDLINKSQQLTISFLGNTKTVNSSVQTGDAGTNLSVDLTRSQNFNSDSVTIPFREGFEDKNRFLSIWELKADGSNAVFEQESAIKFSGQKSYSIMASNKPAIGFTNNWPGIYFKEPVVLDPQKKYIFRINVYTKETALVLFGLDFYNNRQKFIGGISTGSEILQKKDGWKELSLTVAPSKDTAFEPYNAVVPFIKLSLLYDAYPSMIIPNGTFTKIYCDDFEIIEIR